MLDLSLLDKQVVLLPSPPPAAALPGFIDDVYTKERLVKIVQSLVVPFFEQRPGTRYVELAPNARKAQYVKAVLEVFGDRETFRSFVASFPRDFRLVFDRLTWYGPSTVGKLEEVLGVTIAPPAPKPPRSSLAFYGYDKRELPDPYALFETARSYYSYYDDPAQQTLNVRPELRALFQSYLAVPPAALLRPATPPEGLRRYGREATALRTLQRCAVFVQEGHLTLGKTDKPLKASLRKMQEVCEVAEFFDDTKGPLSHLATSFLADVVLDYGLSGTPDDPLAYLTALLDRFHARSLPPLAGLFLTHLKGRGGLDDDFNERQTRLALLRLLTKLPPDEWVSVDALHDHAAVLSFFLRPISMQDASRLRVDVLVKRYGESQRRYYTSEGTVTVDYYEHAVTRPLLQGYLALAAALGLVDLAYADPANDVVRNASYDFLTPFDGLRYVRLNALGAYLTGRASSYEAPAVEAGPAATVTLDDAYLTFTLTGEDRIKEMIAEQVAERLGPGRYRVDYAAFLRGCTTRDDVDAQIERFRNHLSAEVPAHWQAFFDEVRHKIAPLQHESRKLVFRLDGGPELTALFARDEVLRRYVLRAEERHVIVDEKDLSRVRKRLEAFGYLMPR